MRRFFLIFASAFIGFSMLPLAYPDGFAAVAIVGLLSAGSILLIRGTTSEKEFLTDLFISALLLRLVFGLFVPSYDLPGFFGGGAHTYSFFGYAVMHDLFGELSRTCFSAT